MCRQQSAIDQALELLRPGGTLMLVGIPREDRISFSIDKMRRKELTVINVAARNHCPQTAIDWIASGKADIDFMVTIISRLIRPTPLLSPGIGMASSRP